MRHPDDPAYVTGVVGCGAMGQGIAQVSAQGGARTILYDAREGGAAAAQQRIGGHIDRMAEKGRVSADEAEAAKGRLEVAGDLAGLADCDAVIEAIFEDLDAKQKLFRELEAVVRPDCLIASNTSSIPIASIARACEHRARVGGLHFFNPVPLMKLVEVIRAAETSCPGGRAPDGARPAHGAHPGRGQGQPGLPRQHGRARLHHRGAAHRA